ncbi:nesprin-1-like [Notothenia coriiceps]|uniref:Nesprin-1-like n=1 Tax=Notothenia coriiceps TaxID=8208 RepID=A0A6I9NUR9_9TELE|nr:PREDICTED: nesprin-1-like [Notothenia coriiceps]
MSLESCSICLEDVQTEAPLHLLRLKVHVERKQLEVLMQDSEAELTRENRHLAGTGSERLVREHRAFFRDQGPLSVCEKRLQTMEETCLKLPEGDAALQTLEGARKDFCDLKQEIQSTHQKLLQHQDKWKEYSAR